MPAKVGLSLHAVKRNSSFDVQKGLPLQPFQAIATEDVFCKVPVRSKENAKAQRSFATARADRELQAT
jgi:hypothetical protein